MPPRYWSLLLKVTAFRWTQPGSMCFKARRSVPAMHVHLMSRVKPLGRLASIKLAGEGN